MSSAGKSTEARVPQSDVAAMYNGVARFCDAWAALTEAKARRRALARRRGHPRSGGGDRAGACALLRRNPNGHVSGIDLSPEMLARARNRLEREGLPASGLSVASAFAIPAGDASFDLVFNSYMFDLIAEGDWPKVLAEFHRVLRPGGRLVLTNMTKGQRFGSGVYERIYRWKPRLMGRLAGRAAPDAARGRRLCGAFAGVLAAGALPVGSDRGV